MIWRANSIALALLLMISVSCARLAPGPVVDLVSPNPPGMPSVVLIRGFQDWYSTGIDQLARQLRDDGFASEAFREEQWSDVANELADAGNNHPHRPVFLIGYSYGADDVILIARRLNQTHLPIDLLITIDPVTPADIPTNVKRCVNFYEPNGAWDMLPWLRGIPVKGEPGERVENINIRARADLNEAGTSHATIAANTRLHQAIRNIVAGANMPAIEYRFLGLLGETRITLTATGLLTLTDTDPMGKPVANSRQLTRDEMDQVAIATAASLKRPDVTVPSTDFAAYRTIGDQTFHDPGINTRFQPLDSYLAKMCEPLWPENTANP
jgi:pimeloyl-ACP methyl ester carboxylesterase